MLRRQKSSSHPGERIIFKTKPRFVVHSTSLLIKFVLIVILLSFARTIIELAFQLQQNIINQVQLPLVEWVTYFIGLVVLIIFLFSLIDLFKWRQKKYILTNYRVIVKDGFFRKRRSNIHYDKIQDIIVSQGILERLFSSGDIEIFGGHETTTVVLEDVPNPLEVEDMINRLIEGDEKSFLVNKKSKANPSIIQEYDKKFKR